MGYSSCSDIAVTAHCREKEKKMAFFNYRKITATQTCESTEGAVAVPQLISSHSLRDSKSEKKQPALSV